MSETLYRYYESELVFIRQMAQEFARTYPGAASRLLLDANRSAELFEKEFHVRTFFRQAAPVRL